MMRRITWQVPDSENSNTGVKAFFFLTNGRNLPCAPTKDAWTVSEYLSSNNNKVDDSEAYKVYISSSAQTWE